LSPSIEAFALQLPGREDLGRIAHYDRWSDMIADARDAVARLPDGPLAFYGHSLGALIALDLARAHRARIAHLFCAARPWPGAPAPDRGFLGAPEISLEKLVEAYGDAPPSFRDPEIRDYALPILANDLKLLASYAYDGAAGLGCPLTVFAGARDPVTSGGDLMLWDRETSGSTDIVVLNEGHYFLEPARARLAQEISARLDAA
jgi:medium-chain acyl-[acyl-carrier-protein] hydrolase